MNKCQVGAADGVNSDAYYVAIMKFYGRGVRQDQRGAISALKKLSDDAFAPATHFLAMIYYHGICSTCRYKAENDSFTVQKDIKAVEFYVKRYSKNPARSTQVATNLLNAIGKYYYFLKKGEWKVNHKLAFRYFTMAQKLGSSRSTLYIANLLLYTNICRIEIEKRACVCCIPCTEKCPSFL